MNPNQMITDVETQLKYAIVDTKNIHSMLYRENDSELYNNSTYAASRMPYEYRNWLTENGHDSNEYTSDAGLTSMAYDRSIIIDLHSFGDWIDIFNERENNFLVLMQKITELFHAQVLEMYSNDRQNIARNHHELLGWHDWLDELHEDEHFQLEPSQVQANGYRTCLLYTSPSPRD